MTESPRPEQSSHDDPLSCTASPSRLHSMYLEGRLNRAAFETGMRELGVSQRWEWWIRHVLLVLGVGLVLSGILFFIAFNWMELDKAVKLGGLATLIVVSVVIASWRGLDRVLGRVLLFAASVLTGIFLAAFGQIYQSGADAWELFRAWAILIALWALASRAPEHWLLLLVVVDVAITLYVDQVMQQRFLIDERWPWIVLAGVQILAIVGLHVGNTTGYFRPACAWPRWLLVPGTAFLIGAPLTAVVFDDRYDRVDSWIAIAMLVAFVVVGYRYFRFVVHDLFSLTCVGFTAAWMATALFVRVLDVSESQGCGSLLIVGFFIVGLLTALVQWLRRVHAEMGGGTDA